MRRLTRRLALPIFGVLWITVLLFFWVTKRKLEVPLGPEVQTPKVCRFVAHRAQGTGHWQVEGCVVHALGLRVQMQGCRGAASGEQARDAAMGRCLWNLRSLGRLHIFGVCKWQWAWVVGARSQTEPGSQLD